MRKLRRKTRLTDTAAIAISSLLLAVNLMVRDPRPGAASVNASATTQVDPALIITMLFMMLGMCVVAYGLYHDRHNVKQHAHLRMVQTRHRLKLRLRAARRSLSYPGLRRAIERA
ncbi:MAG: hypothetical protein ABI963_05395 [Rhizomicrobium sp.]